VSPPANSPRRRLAAVWFADLVDYTALSSRDEDAALRLAQALHAAAADAVGPRAGRIVKLLGDGVLAEFPGPSDAALASFALLEAFGDESEAGVRIGIHVGEVTATSDGDLYGEGVNLASRLQTIAQPGQVVVSEDVARQLGRRTEFELAGLGPREIRGLPEPLAVFAVRPRPGIDLHRPSRAAERPAPEARSIAVLPFANLSADRENEYFSDGVTEEILTALAQVDGLKVISRTSAMCYKGTDKGLRQIGDELGVATVLEGSVRRAGDRVRITAQLIDAKSDEHLWAERYDRQLEDIFAIQADVAGRIVDALKVRLTPGERRRLCGCPTGDVEAYHRYLKGLHFWNRRSPEDIERAVGHFRAALELDPGLAAAHAGLATSYALLPAWRPQEWAEHLDRSEAEARRSLELDPGLAEGHSALAQIHLYRWNWEAAEEEFRRALEGAPGNATALQWFAHYLASVGRFDEAFDLVGRARDVDPLSLPVVTEWGNVRLLARRYDDAVQAYEQALELDPSFQPARYQLAFIHQLLGRYAEALEQWVAVGVISAEERDTYVTALDEVDAGRYLAELIVVAEERDAPPSFIAMIHGRIGDLDAAFQALEAALEVRDPYLMTLPVNPQFDPLREDPRFAALIERIGLDRVARPGPAAG